MIQSGIPLIVGAGPVGLGAALLLRQTGVATRIIDMANEPSHYSKALAVNPRTLELLEPTGITQKMLAIGLRVRGVRMQLDGKWKRELFLDSLNHKYPFMLALSQATTEQLLTRALEAAGGKVERGVALTACRNQGDNRVVAELKHSADGSIETWECPWMLAADGAHSTARSALNIDFKGSSFERPWYLADGPLKTSLEENLAHVLFPRDGGFLFALRVVDETAQQNQSSPLWRVISDRPNPVERVPNSTPTGTPIWTSEFRIAHRINATLQSGNIFFAGDAAHLHSPMGARGMNLGLEDAWVFSQLIQSGHVEQYGALRKRVDESVVNRIKLLSRVTAGESFGPRLTRAVVMRWLTRIPAVQARFMEAVTGLDHPLDLGENSPEGPRETARRGSGKLSSRHAH